MPQLELRNICHAYGRQTIVDDLSLSLTEGDIGCLLGASGCGKTTVLRLIAGFEAPVAGSIHLHGKTVADRQTLVPPERRHIGMVFQDYALFPHLSVRDNIAFGIRDIRQKPLLQRRVDELLDLVGLPGHGGKYPHELSGGQQQRVALARALAPKPWLLLLDEPFSNLDIDLRERLSLEVRSIIKQSGATAVLVTHDQHEAFAVADIVGIMQRGRIVQWDTPYHLYHRPATRYVADFIGQGVLVPGEVSGPGTVRTELGEIAGTAPPDCTPGSRVAVLLRPDDIVHDDAAPRLAEVEKKVFRGAEFMYTLKLPSGTRLLALVPSHHDHAPGEKIGIRLDVDHLVAFTTHARP